MTAGRTLQSKPEECVRRFRRSKRGATTAEPAHSERPLSELCWMLGATKDDPIHPARVTIESSRLLIDPVTESADRVDRSIGRLARIDNRHAELELHFVTDANTIDLTRLRFPSTDKADVVLRRLLDAYELTTRQRFPDAWLQRQPVPESQRLREGGQ